MTPDQLDTDLDFNSVAEAGSQLGAAAVIVIDDRACMVQLALRSTQFYMHESCGKCTPCREGTRWMVQILEKIERGEGELSDLDLLRSEEHTSELQSRRDHVCRLLPEKKKKDLVVDADPQ